MLFTEDLLPTQMLILKYLHVWEDEVSRVAWNELKGGTSEQGSQRGISTPVLLVGNVVMIQGWVEGRMGGVCMRDPRKEDLKGLGFLRDL